MLEFKMHQLIAGMVTHRWTVKNAKDQLELGFIGWHSGWRRYVFEPKDETVFDSECLMELAEFLQSATRLQQEDARQRRLQLKGESDATTRPQ